MPMDERSGRAMEYSWLRSDRPPRRIVAIFDQATERTAAGNRLTGLRGLLSNPGSSARRTRRDHQRVNQPGMRVTSTLGQAGKTGTYENKHHIHILFQDFNPL